MKATSLLILSGLLAVAPGSAMAKTVKFNDLPAAVQRVAQTELKDGALKNLESMDYKGRSIYAFTFQRPDGSNKVIYLDSDGTYVRDQNLGPAGASSTSSQEIQLKQTPESVQRVIQTETKNGPVSKIMQVPHNGAAIYEVFFKEANGQEKTIYLNPDGTYVRDRDPSASKGNSWARDSRPPLSGAMKVTLNQLPQAVQRTIQSEAGSSQIDGIERGILNGQAVSEATFKKNGQTTKVRVTDNGSILSDSLNSRMARGGSLQNGTPVSFGSLPPAIQSALRAQAGQSEIRDIQQGQVNGQTVYQASVSPNGESAQVRLDSHGALLSRSARQSSVLSPQP